MDGVSNLVFLAPALMAAAAMQGAMVEIMRPIPTRASCGNKGFNAMRATSLTGGQVADGVLLAAMTRVALTSTVYWIALRAFGWPAHWSSALTLIPIAILAGTCWVPSCSQSPVTPEERRRALISISMRLVIMPMFLFSGTLYPLSTLPCDDSSGVGWLSPLWYATELGRWASYGMDLPGWLAVLGLAYLVGIGLASHLIARRRFELRLTS
jgi:lipooligosaccharide transport system permease protein